MFIKKIFITLVLFFSSISLAWRDAGKIECEILLSKAQREYNIAVAQRESLIKEEQKGKAKSVWALYGIAILGASLAIYSGYTDGLILKGQMWHKHGVHYDERANLDVQIGALVSVVAGGLGYLFDGKKAEQKCICARFKEFQALHDDFEIFVAKTKQDLSKKENSESDAFISMIEKTKADWKMQLDACKKNKLEKQ